MVTWKQLKKVLEDPVVSKALFALIGIVAILIFVRIFRKWVTKYIKDNGTKYRIRKSVSFLGYASGVLLLLLIFEVKLTGITVALGVAGAGIAFALQEVIVSTAGYIAIMAGSFYSVGDRVMLGGIKGDVVDIGALRTTIMEIGDWVNGDLYNGKMVRIANSFIFKEPVYNYSSDFPFLWDEMTVPIKTNGDHILAEQLFSEILTETVGEYAIEAKKTWKIMTNKYRLENASVVPMVTFVFDENWITFTLRYVVDYKSRRGTKHKLSKLVLETVRNSKGRIEIASAAFEITAFPRGVNSN